MKQQFALALAGCLGLAVSTGFSQGIITVWEPSETSDADPQPATEVFMPSSLMPVMGLQSEAGTGITDNLPLPLTFGENYSLLAGIYDPALALDLAQVHSAPALTTVTTISHRPVKDDFQASMDATPEAGKTIDLPSGLSFHIY